MSQKRAATGFKGIALAPVTENTLTSYKTSAAESLPYAGSMSRTSKESSTDLYYDDDLYAQIKNVMGEDVELHMAEVPLDRMADLGLGAYDETSDTLEADFNAAGKEYALRFVVDTVSGLPFYFNYRLFQLTGIKFDNFTTKQDSVTVCEVIITGVFKRPNMAGLCAVGRDAAQGRQEQSGQVHGLHHGGGDEAGHLKSRPGDGKPSPRRFLRTNKRRPHDALGRVLETAGGSQHGRRAAGRGAAPCPAGQGLPSGGAGAGRRGAAHPRHIREAL